MTFHNVEMVLGTSHMSYFLQQSFLPSLRNARKPVTEYYFLRLTALACKHPTYT
jgi:hypothetical protein